MTETNQPPAQASRREKVILIVLLIAIALAIGLYLFWPKEKPAETGSAAPTTTATSKYNIATISALELKEQLDRQDKLILIDVRKPVEYTEGHVSGATNIPLADLEKWKKYLPTDADLVTMCDGSDCQRSQAASEKLTDWGFKRVKNFKGGTKEWKQQAFPVVIGLISDVQLLKIPPISASELNSQIKAGALNTILDVRNSVDYSQGHIPKARNVSFSGVEKLAQNQEINLELPVVVYGGPNDVSTATAARTLLANGALNLSVLEGDFESWQAGNFPVEKSNQ